MSFLKGTYFDRVDDMPKYIKYRVSTLSGNIAGDYKITYLRKQRL